MNHTFQTLTLAALLLGAVGCANSSFTSAGKTLTGKNGGKDGGHGGPDGENVDEKNKGLGDTDSGGKDGKDGHDGGDGPDGGSGHDGGHGNDSGGGGTDSGGDAAQDTGGLWTDDDGACLKTLVPLHAVFAIDSTGSMEEEIAAVTTNAVAFATSIQSLEISGTKQKIPSVKVGAVSYVDVPGDNRVFDLSDPGTFASQVNGLGTRGFINDHCEGGLQAAKAGLEMLNSGGNSIKLLIVISDNYSHDGTGADGARSFNDSALKVLAIGKGLANFLLFDSVPTSTNVPTFTACNVPNITPAAQWEPIRKAWEEKHPKAKLSPGKNVSFPFSSATLLQEIPALVKKLVRVCH